MASHLSLLAIALLALVFAFASDAQLVDDITQLETSASAPKPKSSPKGAPKAAPKGAPKPAPKGAPKLAPKGAPKLAPKGAPKPAPKGAPKPAPKGAPKLAPKGAPKPAPKGAPNPYPKWAPKPALKWAPKPYPKPAPRLAPRPSPKAAPKPSPKAAPKPSPKAAPKPSPKAAPKPPPKTNVVTIPWGTSSSALDTTKTIKVGDRVDWVWSDGAPHDIEDTDFVRNEFTGPGGAGQIKTAPFTYSHVFTKPGIYNYLCGVHDFMTGTITVEA